MKEALFALAAAAALSAGAAQAQVCAGFPIHENQGSIDALANFPSGFDQYGVEGAFNFNGPLSLNAGYVYSHDPDLGGHLDTFRAGAALDITPMVGAMLPGLSICPNVRADFISSNGDNVQQIPIGLGIGASLPIGGPTMTLTPYVIPALVVTHSSVSGFGSTTDTDFGVRGGADLNFDRFYLGGTVEWVNNGSIYNGDTSALFGVRAGIKF